MSDLSWVLLLNSSAWMASGDFYKPEVVLDNVARSKPTADGVIVITTRDVSGRIGITNNSIITGGLVDATGETGITAVCKLLLLPYGSYSFRRAVPMDKLHLEQDLNLPIDEAKKFLSGPSSIGLACPAEHALSNLKAKCQPEPGRTDGAGGDDFNWESTSFRTSFEPAVPDSEIDGSEVYVQDCNKLLESLSERRKEEAFVLNQPRKTHSDLKALKPGPLPSRKKPGEKFKLDPIWVFAAVSIILGVIGFSMLAKPMQSASTGSEPNVASVETAAKPAPVTAAPLDPGARANADKPAQGQAPFSFPSGPATAPPPSPSAETETPSDSQPEPQAQVASAPPAPSPVANQEVLRWMDEVRKNPTDAEARRKLSHAYLVAGDLSSSLEQFYTVMKREKVDSSEIIAYADNIIVFCGKDRARQFLTDVLRADPAKTAIRERLASIR